VTDVLADVAKVTVMVEHLDGTASVLCADGFELVGEPTVTVNKSDPLFGPVRFAFIARRVTFWNRSDTPMELGT
jgi:hypothetical protein